MPPPRGNNPHHGKAVCGPGELLGHLVQSNYFEQGAPAAPLDHTLPYRGVDCYPEAVARAQERFFCGVFEVADFTGEILCGFEGSDALIAETVFAIGAMIDGNPCGKHQRIRRVARFLSHVVPRATGQGVIVMLSQDYLEQSAHLHLEQPLFGVSVVDELESMCQWLEREFDVYTHIRPVALSSDIVLYWRRKDYEQTHEVTPLHDLEHREALALCKKVFELCEEEGRPQWFWRGWLLSQLGLAMQAHDALSEAMVSDDAYTRRKAALLLERLQG